MGPFLRTKNSTNKIMLNLLIALLPIIIFTVYKNGYVPYSHGLISFIEIFNPLLNILSIFILSYTFFWQEYLKQDLKNLHQNNKKYIIIFIILFCIFIIIEFITIIFTMLLKVNWGYISNFSVEETYLIMLIYQLIFPIIDLVRNKRNKA